MSRGCKKKQIDDRRLLQTGLSGEGSVVGKGLRNTGADRVVTKKGQQGQGTGT